MEQHTIRFTTEDYDTRGNLDPSIQFRKLAITHFGYSLLGICREQYSRNNQSSEYPTVPTDGIFEATFASRESGTMREMITISLGFSGFHLNMIDVTWRIHDVDSSIHWELQNPTELFEFPELGRFTVTGPFFVGKLHMDGSYTGLESIPYKGQESTAVRVWDAFLSEYIHSLMRLPLSVCVVRIAEKSHNG